MQVKALEADKIEAGKKREREMEQSAMLVSSYTRLYSHWLMWKINSWRTQPTDN